MRSRVVTAIIFIAIVAAGIVAGVMISNRMVKQHFQRVEHFRWDEDFSERTLNRLNCTPEQRKKVKPILERYGQSFKKMHQRHFKEIGKMRSEMEQALSKVITPEQLKALTERRPPHDRPPHHRPPHFNDDRPHRPPHHRKPPPHHHPDHRPPHLKDHQPRNYTPNDR